MNLTGPLWPYLLEAEESVISRAQKGDSGATEYMLYRYKNLVRQLVKPYFLVGAEKDDLIQVGMIGLWQAIMDFREEKQSCFSAFARICITRHVLSAVKGALRFHHQPLNTCVLFGTEPDGWPDLSDRIADRTMAPERVLIESERRAELEQRLSDRLSAFEREVLDRYCIGKSYCEISSELRCSTKAVDNALMRIKRKVARQA